MKTQLWLTLAAGAAAFAPAAALFADPPADPQVPPVFCFRITDIERLPGDVSGGTYCIEFEVLNWTDRRAEGLLIAQNVGTAAVFPPFSPMGSGGPPALFQVDVDRDGRGGDIFTPAQIGPGVFDTPAIHSGRGRGDLGPSFFNDWSFGGSLGATSALWLGGTPIPSRDLLGALAAGGPAASYALVPGLGTDALGDSAVDGGRPPFSPDPPGTPFPTGGPVVPDGSGNVLDGFVMYVCDWDKGETLSLNWFLTDASGAPLGTAGMGNAYGFGTVSLFLGAPGQPAGPLFAGNTGFGSNAVDIFDDVGLIIDDDGKPRCEFFVEMGAGITAPFQNPNVQQQLQQFEAFPNTEPIFEQRHPCSQGGGTGDPCPTDLNDDGVTGAADLARVIGAWGPCP